MSLLELKAEGRRSGAAVLSRFLKLLLVPSDVLTDTVQAPHILSQCFRCSRAHFALVKGLEVHVPQKIGLR